MRRDEEGLSEIVRTVARETLAVILVYGLGLAFYGHLTPGGGFPGGVCAACGLVMAVLASGSRSGFVAAIRGRVAALEAFGALGYLGVAALGWTAGQFMQSSLPRGTPFTPEGAPFLVILNLAVLLKVGAGLFAGFAALVAFGREAPPAGGGEGRA